MCRSRENKSKESTDPTISESIRWFQQQDRDPRQLLPNLLAAHCILGQAESGAVLRAGQGTNIDVLAIYPELKKVESAPGWLAKSAGFVQEVLSSDGPIVKSIDQQNGPESGEQDGHHILMIPSVVVTLGKAIMAFLIRADGKTSLESSSHRLQLLVGMLGHFQAGAAQQNWQESCKRLQQATETLSTVNREQKFTSAAMAFCNEVASQWQCERASVGFLKGRYVQLKAMSHTEHFSRKMEAVQDIEAAMEECLDQDIEILSPAPRESAYVSRAAGRLSERHGLQNLLSLPLRSSDGPVGVVILERPSDRPFSFDEIETIRLACELCTARLTDLYEHDRWIGAVIAGRTCGFLAKLVGPRHTWAKVAAILCFGAILFLVFAKGQFKPHAPFVLEATYQQVVPAPFDGYIKNVEVEIGDLVDGGSSVLAGLDTAELRLSLAAAKAEKAGYLKQAAAARRDGEIAQAQIAEADADKAQAQVDLLEYQISQASLVSQISGVVVNGDNDVLSASYNDSKIAWYENLGTTTAGSPEITVLGNGVSFMDGDSTPSKADWTDFGFVGQGGSPISRVFTVRNDGTATLTLGAVTVPTGYTLTEDLSASLAAGASDAFTVQLDTAVLGANSGDISFSNNDSDENPFNFQIT